MILNELAENTWARIIGFKGNEKIQERMTQHGIYPGDRTRVLRTAPLRGPILVEVSGREVIIGQSMAKNILVELSE
jgi:Fe2+ transport system protein FeoA